jgi:hypothetical protein
MTGITKTVSDNRPFVIVGSDTLQTHRRCLQERPMQPTPPPDNSRHIHPPDTGTSQWQPPTSTGHPVAVSQRLRIGDMLAFVGAAFVFFFSFAPFVRYPRRAVAEVARAADLPFDGWYSAWSVQMFMAPLSWAPMFAVLGVVGLALVRVMTGRDPEILRFRMSQLQVGLAFLATVVLFGYAFSRKQSAFGIEQLLTSSSDIERNDAVRPVFAWGGYLMLLGVVICLVGAVLNHFNVGPAMSAAIAAVSQPGGGQAAEPGWAGYPAQPVPPQYPHQHPGPVQQQPNPMYQPAPYPAPAQYPHHDQYGPVPPSRHAAE